MYEIFEQLLRQNGVTAYKVAKATGIATATLSDWKNGRSEPKQDKMQKIADYFGVSLVYLLTGKEPITSAYEDQTIQIAEKISSNPALLKLFQSAIKATDTDIQTCLIVLNALLEKDSYLDIKKPLK